MNGRICVFIVGDHPVIRHGLALLLQEYSGIEVAGEFGHRQDVVGEIQRFQPDVVLIDVDAPDASVLDTIRRVSNLLPETAVVVFLSDEDEVFLVQVIQASVLGYMSRKGEVSELITAIRTVHSGQAFIHPHMATNLLGARLRRGQNRDIYEALTSRERQVLPLLAQGYTNQEVADMLFLSPHTIQTYRQHIMRKLEVHSKADLLRFALLRGLISLD